MRSLSLFAALLAVTTAQSQPATAAHDEEFVLGCAVTNALVAVRFERDSPLKAALEERAIAYSRLARREFGVTEAAIAVGLRALNSKVNTGVTAWSDVVAYAEQCPAVPTA